MGGEAGDDHPQRPPRSRAGLVLLPLLIGVLWAAPALASVAPPAPPSAPPSLSLHGSATALTTTGDAVWAAESAPTGLVRTSGGAATRFALAPATSGSAPVTSLAPRSASSVWYARPAAGVIGWVDKDGTSGEIPLSGEPRYVARGSNGSVWALETATGNLDRFSVGGALLEQHAVGAFSAETLSVVTNGLATDSTGVVWLLRRAGQTELGRLKEDGTVTWVPVPLSGENYPVSLAAGPDGRMWGTAESEAGGVLFRVTSGGGVDAATTFPLAEIGGAAAGPDGNLWTTTSEWLADGWHSNLVRVGPTGAVLDREPIGTVTGPATALQLTGAQDTLWYSPADRSNLTGRVLPLETSYLALGGPSSLLGSPTSAEYPVVRAWARNFSGGRMYWSATTGSHEVHGLILDRYLRLGGPGTFLGLPTTDEKPSATRTGRYSVFSGGVVVWSPPTGAHEVHGAIQARWSALRAEGGRLGFPVTDEFTPFAGARQNNFQHGSIRWMANTGTTSVLPH